MIEPCSASPIESIASCCTAVPHAGQSLDARTVGDVGAQVCSCLLQRFTMWRRINHGSPRHCSSKPFSNALGGGDQRPKFLRRMRRPHDGCKDAARRRASASRVRALRRLRRLREPESGRRGRRARAPDGKVLLRSAPSSRGWAPGASPAASMELGETTREPLRPRGKRSRKRVPSSIRRRWLCSLCITCRARCRSSTKHRCQQMPNLKRRRRRARTKLFVSPTRQGGFVLSHSDSGALLWCFSGC